MRNNSPKWIVCQIGARERYAIARELHRRGQLAALCTDIWVSPDSAMGNLARVAGARGASLLERYEPALEGARVFSEPVAPVVLQRARAQRRAGGALWRPLMETNRWLGARMAARLENSGLLRTDADRKLPIVFSYSYAAREIFETARRFGCRTVLGQIDPGPTEDDIVAEVARRHGLGDVGHQRAPQEYWENWRQECELADMIVVNSSWSAECLEKAGVSASKIHVAPLAYEDHDARNGIQHRRRYPAAFSHERPLQLLFLGQVGLRKGAFEILKAMERLQDLPVKLNVIGTDQARLKDLFPPSPQIAWIGKVSHAETGSYYKSSDLFLLPTHSDGFALTQLEAQSHGLPILASARCGEVVTDGFNGRLVDPVSTAAIEKLIRWSFGNPAALQKMSEQSSKHAKIFTASRAVDAMIEAGSEHSF